MQINSATNNYVDMGDRLLYQKSQLSKGIERVDRDS